MKSRKLLIWPIISGLLLSSACTSATNPANPLIIDKADQCSFVQLSIGQTFVLSLPTNPTTGYNWTVNHTPSQLTPITKQEYIRDQHEPAMVGGGGKTLWKYKAVDQGTGTLEIIYHRPWEKDTKPIQTVRCQITVK